MIHTRACDVLGITHPVVQAPVGAGSCPALVAAVSGAGGLGILAASWTEPDAIHKQIADIRTRTSKPFGVNFVLGQASPEQIEVAFAERVPVLSLFRGSDPSELVRRAHAQEMLTVHQVTTVEEAQVSVAAGTDVIIAQGREAGGHMGPHPLWTLLPQVIAIAESTPVLASGSLVDGRDLAAALMIGASGVQMGTRFLATPESSASERYKELIVAARDGGTVASKMWDILWGQSWPGVRVRALRNDFTDRWAGREDELIAQLPLAQAELNAAYEANDHTKIHLLAGEGSARIESIRPAADIVRSVVADAEQVLRDAGALLN